MPSPALQRGGAALFFQQVLAQGGAEAWHVRQHEQRLQQRWRQAGQHLALQVVEQQRGAGGQALVQVVGMAADQQQADAGQPAFAVMQQLAGQLVGQRLLALQQ